MYDDVNMELKDAKLADEGKGDEEMTDAEKDEALAITTVAPALVASSSRSVSSNCGSIFLNLDSISSVETEIISILSKLEKEVKELKNFDHSSTLLATIKSEVPMALKEYLGAIIDEALHKKRTLFETMTKSKSFDRNTKHRALYHALVESILEDEEAMDKGVADKLTKRKPDDADKDEDPLARPGQRLKRKKTSKDDEPSKKVKLTDTSKGTNKSQPKTIGKFAQAKEAVFKARDTQMPQNQEEDMGKTDEPPSVKADPNDWFKKPKRPPTPDPE
ncbi:hypothetical protein Tco_1394836 [Tanacetum coccineum]